ncbi:hypothetical protein AFLA_007852 [Aspergillus flavus NRRL3357]|nr:hypothetical protein AFLA_007852 [Aspergillus flavus NRRL3357]
MQNRDKESTDAAEIHFESQRTGLTPRTSKRTVAVASPEPRTTMGPPLPGLSASLTLEGTAGTPAVQIPVWLPGVLRDVGSWFISGVVQCVP